MNETEKCSCSKVLGMRMKRGDSDRHSICATAEIYKCFQGKRSLVNRNRYAPWICRQERLLFEVRNASDVEHFLYLQ